MESIPPELFNLGHIVLSLQATKPRTVGANTAVIITLPADRTLEFAESIHRGTLIRHYLQYNILNLDPIGTVNY
uniref:SFRICE_034349 n=1 Tax=Spodoptera frugiperda TaxID=7108 RepID=A0A2H1WPP8_SPOFR